MGQRVETVDMEKALIQAYDRKVVSEPKREGQLTREFGGVADACERLLAAIHRLEQNLSDVLRDQEPREEAKVLAGGPPRVPAAAQLANVHDIIVGAWHQIDDLSERLEL